MKILALDLGKYKTVGCIYESESGAHWFKRTFTTRESLARLVQEVKPERVVIEICSIAGWVCDLLWGLGVEVQVANTSDDAWRWRERRGGITRQGSRVVRSLLVEVAWAGLRHKPGCDKPISVSVAARKRARRLPSWRWGESC